MLRYNRRTIRPFSESQNPMEAIPEKPKRKRGESRFSSGKVIIIMLLVMAVALPVSLTTAFGTANERMARTLIIGYMICCSVYIVYRLVLWLVFELESPIEASDHLSHPSTE